MPSVLELQGHPGVREKSCLEFAQTSRIVKICVLRPVATAPQTPPHHELSFIKVRGRFCRKQKTHAAVPSPKKSGGFEINGV